MSDAVSCFVISLWIAQNSGLLRIIADTLTKADHELKYWRCGDHQYDMYAFGYHGFCWNGLELPCATQATRRVSSQT